MYDLFRELRSSIRGLRRDPGYALVAILTLALGIGATTAIYTVLEKVVLNPLPYPEAERLVRIRNPVPGVEADAEWQLSPAQYLYYGEHARSFDEIGMYRLGGVNVTGRDGAIRGRIGVATASVFRMLGARATLGRVPDARDDSPEAPPVSVLSHAFWQREFGGDPGVVGRTLQLNESPYEIVGVLEAGLTLPESFGPAATPEIWIPYRLDPRRDWLFSHVVPGIARLAPGVTVETAQAEIERLRAGLTEAHPQQYAPRFFERYGFRTRLAPLKSDVVGGIDRNLWVLFGAVALVLLIAAANVANLFLVRVEGRRRELAVRGALGASRATIARHFLAESLALAVVGGLLGVILGLWGVDWLVATAPPTIPRLGEIRLDGSVLLVALGLSIVVAIALGGIAVARHGRQSGISALGEGGRSATVGRERQRVRSALVVTQVALALVLIVGAGLLLESFRRLRAVDPGLDPEGVVTMSLHLPPARYDDWASRWQFYRAALERVRALPGVTAAGMSANLPFGGGFGCTVQGFEDPAVAERLAAEGGTSCAGQVATTPGYFEAMRIPLVRGRLFTDRDNDHPETAAVVVSRAFAERFWPGEDPIGKGVLPNGRRGDRYFRVVGVVGDVYAESPDEDPALAIYYPTMPIPGFAGAWADGMALVVRTTLADPVSLFPAIRSAIAELDPAIPLADVEAMRTIVDRSMSRLSFTLVLLGVSAAVALLLAAIGLYGVIAYIVTRRTGELGVRVALGARPRQVERLVVGGSLKLVLLGVGGGIATALFLTRLMRGLLYGVEPTHPVAYVAAAALLAAVAALASWLPARRAARVDPMVAMRVE